MSKGRILFVNQEITPYLKESHMANIGRYLPQGIQETGKEIRNIIANALHKPDRIFTI